MTDPPEMIEAVRRAMYDGVGLFPNGDPEIMPDEFLDTLRACGYEVVKAARWGARGREEVTECWSCRRQHTGWVWCPHCSAPVDPASREALASPYWQRDPRRDAARALFWGDEKK